MTASATATRALVLSGGGARGAYEAGVIGWLRDGLPERDRARVKFDILSGTSVGAINACWLAATAHEPETQGRRLAGLWRSLVLERDLGVATFRILRLAGRLALGRSTDSGLLDPHGLHAIVKGELDWSAIGTNLARGHLSALSVSATDIASGRTYVFVQRSQGGLPTWSRDPHVRAVAETITADHAIASAAIPMLFAPVLVDGRLFCDGGLRQNTPLSPALRLGADRVMVIGLRAAQRLQHDDPLPPRYGSLPFLLGKTLDALLLDHTDYDLDRLRRINAIVDAVQAVDPRCAELWQAAVESGRGAGYRGIRELLIRPSEDIGRIAARHAKRVRDSGRLGGLSARLLDWVTGSGESEESDLVSYLLFDGDYAAELIELGRADAAAHKDEICDFFG